MEKTKSLVSFISGSTKSEIAADAKRMIDYIAESGQVSEEKLFFFVVKMAELQEFIDQMRSSPLFKDVFLESLGRFPDGYKTGNGTRVEQIESGVKYDYGSVDEFWRALKNDLDDIAKKLKVREAFLKSIPQNVPGVVDENGELIAPPPKQSKTTYRVVLAK